jgi:hypothetical protein
LSGWGWGASSELFGSMADKTENQVPNIPNPNLTETIHEVEVHGNPAWKVGGPAWSGLGGSSDLVGSMADETEYQVPNIPNLTETIHEAEVRGNPVWKVGGPAWSNGPAHGQAPPEAAQVTKLTGIITHSHKRRIV